MKAVWMVILISVVLVGGYLYYQSLQRQPHPSVQPNPTVVVTSMASPSVSASPWASSLPTKYISLVDWPPQVRLEKQPFSCTEAGLENGRSGKTKKVFINNHTYCVTEINEGAAGSIYTQYTFARAKGNQTEIFTFSLKSVQCANYPEPEKTACETERKSFTIDSFIDQYIQSY